jgi:hypothetical protein
MRQGLSLSKKEVEALCIRRLREIFTNAPKDADIAIAWLEGDDVVTQTYAVMTWEMKKP